LEPVTIWVKSVVPSIESRVMVAQAQLRFERDSPVSRSNILFLIMGALVIAVAVMGYQLYQDRHPPEGMQIKLGPNGLSIQGK
jgi:hypothetical protein